MLFGANLLSAGSIKTVKIYHILNDRVTLLSDLSHGGLGIPEKPLITMTINSCNNLTVIAIHYQPDTTLVYCLQINQIISRG